ncbi:MAG: diaminopimelate epimerase [Alphaproteobacteria bacterium]|nr:diaminopimelate epimerase [Alphaproteobacteria bacterium]
MTLRFTKACALGNDFVILPLDQLEKECDLQSLSIFLAGRRYGVGCDQVIYAAPTKIPNTFQIRFFNADGSEAESCGNGTRCVAKLLMEQEGSKVISLQTLGGTIFCKAEAGGLISVEFPAPQIVLPVSLDSYPELSALPSVFVQIGNPHLVCFVTGQPDIKTLGPLLETHLHKLDKKFPKNVNVGFATIIDTLTIQLTVWERGSGLTPACGTGACAAVIAASFCNLVTRQQPVTVMQAGGNLSVEWGGGAVQLCGEANSIFKGTIGIQIA